MAREMGERESNVEEKRASEIEKRRFSIIGKQNPQTSLLDALLCNRISPFLMLTNAPPSPFLRAPSLRYTYVGSQRKRRKKQKKKKYTNADSPTRAIACVSRFICLGLSGTRGVYVFYAYIYIYRVVRCMCEMFAFSLFVKDILRNA